MSPEGEGIMESLRKWFYKPKRDDRSLLAQFFFADEALNLVAAELDSFDGRKYPDRCSSLVSQLRHAQDRVLNITSQIMDQLLGSERVARGFRVKFPEDVLQDNLAGQLWFGAECLAAGSSIMHRERESAAMRPLAKALTRSLETVRALLREQCLRARPSPLTPLTHDDVLIESLKIFDRLFAEFELCYVSAMVQVKTPHEFEQQQHLCVLFSETLQRALRVGLLTTEQVDSCDPGLMFAVPRLAIVAGLLRYTSGPLAIDHSPENMSDMFRPFRTLLHKIRSLLWTLDRGELRALERLLCTQDGSSVPLHTTTDEDLGEDDDGCLYQNIGMFASQLYKEHTSCKDSHNNSESITEADYLPENMEVVTPILDGMRRLSTDPAPRHALHVAPARHPSESSDSTTGTSEYRRRTSRTRSDLSSLRNLSSNGLNTFDPLVIHAAEHDLDRPHPDNSLVSSLSEQVSEIADKLSADRAQNPEHPSTSHGFLIPNAISQETTVLAALSHNNLAALADDVAAAEHIAQVISPPNPPDSERPPAFRLGYDSDPEPSPGDSGVSTENTSLDRSPDTDAPVCETSVRETPVRETAETPPARKRKSKSRRRKSRMWSPGNVVIENRTSSTAPLAFNLSRLERLVDSGCADDERLAMALQAQELRATFESSADLVHRLFVCVAGVADQLQTNFAADLRNILKSVFLMNQTPDEPEPEPEPEPQTAQRQNKLDQQVEYETAAVIQSGSLDSVYSAEEAYAESDGGSGGSGSGVARLRRRNTLEPVNKAAESGGPLQSSASTGDLTAHSVAYGNTQPDIQYAAPDSRVLRPPEWVPDTAAPDCARCATHFTAFRRRHHCRNCGKVFCAACSSNSIPLPRYGQMKPVRVCEECFKQVRSEVTRQCRRHTPTAHTNAPHSAPHTTAHRA